MKVAPSLYQFTAIDDCKRIRVHGIYTRQAAANPVLFLEERMLEEFGFPIQRIQTDRGVAMFVIPTLPGTGDRTRSRLGNLQRSQAIARNAGWSGSYLPRRTIAWKICPFAEKCPVQKKRSAIALRFCRVADPGWLVVCHNSNLQFEQMDFSTRRRLFSLSCQVSSSVDSSST